MQLKKTVHELEKAAQGKPSAPRTGADPAELATAKARLAKLQEELEGLRAENEFLNGEVGRYGTRNKELQTQLASLKES
jgi:predicted RNase H-like nuclease (RuvC/YqgF family)